MTEQDTSSTQADVFDLETDEGTYYNLQRTTCAECGSGVVGPAWMQIILCSEECHRAYALAVVRKNQP